MNAHLSSLLPHDLPALARLPLFGLLAATLACPLAARADNPWQSVASACALTPPSVSLASVSTKSGSVALKSGAIGTVTLICPVNYEFSGINALNELALQSFDNDPLGSVTATLMRKDKTTGQVEVLGAVTSSDGASLATKQSDLDPAKIEFFNHAVYVILTIKRGTATARVEAHMSFLTRFIP